MNEPGKYAVPQKEFEELSRKELRAILISTCVGLGADLVTVEFDGGGDQGQVHAVNLWRGKDQIQVSKEIKVPSLVSSARFAGGSWVHAEDAEYVPLEEALSDFCYDVLESDCPGDWVNNEGGYGTLYIRLTSPCSFELEYHQRIIDTKDYNITLFEEDQDDAPDLSCQD